MFLGFATKSVGLCWFLQIAILALVAYTMGVLPGICSMIYPAGVRISSFNFGELSHTCQTLSTVWGTWGGGGGCEPAKRNCSFGEWLHVWSAHKHSAAFAEGRSLCQPVEKIVNRMWAITCVEDCIPADVLWTSLNVLWTSLNVLWTRRLRCHQQSVCIVHCLYTHRGSHTIILYPVEIFDQLKVRVSRTGPEISTGYNRGLRTSCAWPRGGA